MPSKACHLVVQRSELLLVVFGRAAATKQEEGHEESKESAETRERVGCVVCGVTLRLAPLPVTRDSMPDLNLRTCSRTPHHQHPSPNPQPSTPFLTPILNTQSSLSRTHPSSCLLYTSDAADDM
eukprot:552825-Rhodomonas_salina.3